MKNKFEILNTDILIIGAGGAGLRAAIEAYDRNNNTKIIIVSKSLLGKAHTVMAEGGIAASIGDVDSKDNWKVHFADTLREGVYLGNWKMIEILVKEVPERIYELEQYGALFDRTKEGKIMQRAFGAHTYKRLCHIGDKTGLEIIRVLEVQILKRNITILDELQITKIFKNNNKVIGAIGIDFKTGKFVVINCNAVIIASGGSGKLYKITSNSLESTGDGLVLAYDLGCELSDMEMVQFHPTGMVYPQGVKGLLVTEGIRGEGGILLNNKNERFMKKYSPEKMELDARDIVARAIYNEIKIGNGTEHNGVYLDISHKGASFIKKKLPAMYEQYKEFADIDITKQKMEVAPTVHYHMGGIKVNPETNETNIKGVFAAGEVASGVHGANRLGGNSLADILVFGRRTGISCSKYIQKIKKKTNNKISKIMQIQINEEIKRIYSYLNSNLKKSKIKQKINKKILIYELLDSLKITMNNNVEIIKNQEGLTKALSKVYEIRKILKTKDSKVNGTTLYNRGLFARLELENELIIAECIIKSAIKRKESRGTHFRTDFPKKSKEWKKNIICKKENNLLKLTTISINKLPKHLLFVGIEKYD